MERTETRVKDMDRKHYEKTIQRNKIPDEDVTGQNNTKAILNPKEEE